MGVHGNLILCGITNETLIVGKRDVRRGCAISLIVGDDFDTIVLPHTNAAEEGKKRKSRTDARND